MGITLESASAAVNQQQTLQNWQQRFPDNPITRLAPASLGAILAVRTVV